MSNAAVESITEHLRAVEVERGLRRDAPGLAEKVAVVKSYQQRRFALTYADLLDTPRYGPASRFFLGELYGPTDFSRRDAQFARVVPALVRLFPREIVETVVALGALHALSEVLDTCVARQMVASTLDQVSYVRAWQGAGRTSERGRQISLTLEVANRLDRLTRRPLLRNSLRLMRAPAKAAGLSDLQKFLETGFDSFAAMRGAAEFTSLVESRETALVASLFDARPELSGDSGLQALHGRLP
jgi:hypothetical protein